MGMSLTPVKKGFISPGLTASNTKGHEDNVLWWFKNKTGAFSWIPGPGPLGKFHMVSIETAPDGTMTKKNTIVEIDLTNISLNKSQIVTKKSQFYYFEKIAKPTDLW